jgi:hypothetical protein
MNLVDRLWARVADGVHPYETLIFGTRYGGCYEGPPWDCNWAAVGGGTVEEWREFEGASGGDNACADWWDDMWNAPIGRGDTPNGAYADLVRVVTMGRVAFEKMRAAEIHQHEVELGVERA